MSEARDYTAFGLSIRSDLRLWLAAATEADRAIDLEIVVDPGRAPVGSRASLGAPHTSLHVEGLGALSITDGSRITLHPDAKAIPEDLAAFVQGAGIALALAQRGWFVLHGSCVSLGGGSAVSIVGPSGAGKSTVAAALRGRGHALISDGMTPLRVGDGGALETVAGPPFMKLWPDAAARLGWDVTKLARATPALEKRVCEIDEGAPSGSISVSAIVVLGLGAVGSAVPLSPREAVMALVRNAILVEWLDDASAGRLLERAGIVAQRVPVASLARGANLEDLAKAAAAVESMAGATAPRPSQAE